MVTRNLEHKKKLNIISTVKSLSVRKMVYIWNGQRFLNFSEINKVSNHETKLRKIIKFTSSTETTNLM
jgi:hypothetical protein